MSEGARHRQLVQRIDLYLLGVMLVSAGLAAILFWILALNETDIDEDVREAEPTAIARVNSPTISPTQTSQISRTPTPTRTLLPTFTPTNTVAFSPTPSLTLWPSPQVEPLAIGSLYAGEPLIISGEAQPGDRIILTDFGKPIGETTAGEVGTWTFVLQDGLTSGPHELGVIAENEAGRQSAPAAVNFLLNERPTSTPSHTPTYTDTPSPTLTPTATATATITSTPSATATASATSTSSATPSPTATATWTFTLTATYSLTASMTETVIVMATATQTSTASITPSETLLRVRETDTPTPTPSPSSIPSRTSTRTFTPTVTSSLTPSLTKTSTATASITATSSLTSTGTATASLAPSKEPTATPTTTPSYTATSTATPSHTATLTVTASRTFTVTTTPTPTQEFIAPRIISPEDGEVLQTGDVRLIGTGAVGAELEIVDSEGNVLSTVMVDEDQRWSLTIPLNQSGEIALRVRDTARPARPSPVVRLTLAPPIQPETGIQLFEENSDSHGILYTLMLALVSISLGSALIFAGRILYALSRQD